MMIYCYSVIICQLPFNMDTSSDKILLPYNYNNNHNNDSDSMNLVGLDLERRDIMSESHDK